MEKSKRKPAVGERLYEATTVQTGDKKNKGWIILVLILVNIFMWISNNSLLFLDKVKQEPSHIVCVNGHNFIACNDSTHTHIFGSLNFPQNLTSVKFTKNTMCEIKSFLEQSAPDKPNRYYMNATFSAYFYHGRHARCQINAEPTRRPIISVDCDSFESILHSVCRPIE